MVGGRLRGSRLELGGWEVKLEGAWWIWFFVGWVVGG